MSWPHHQLYMRDMTRYYYPAKQVLREIVLHGEFPYWNRYFSSASQSPRIPNMKSSIR